MLAAGPLDPGKANPGELHSIEGLYLAYTGLLSAE